MKIQIYHAGALASGKNAWEAVKNGIADMGWCFHGYWPGMTPLSDVIALPSLPFKTAEQGSEAFMKLYLKHPEIQKEFSDNHVLFAYTSQPYVLMTTKKRVLTLEDIKGMKLRTAGGPPTAQVQALGASPMLVPMPDCYISLQKGLIDGMGVPWEAVIAFRFYEVAPYFTEVPFPALYFSVVMNNKKWESLPKDIQEVITEKSGIEAAKFWGRNYFDSAKEGAVEMAKEAGKDIQPASLSNEELSRWLAIGGNPIWQEWIREMEGKGNNNAQAVLDSLVEILDVEKK